MMVKVELEGHQLNMLIATARSEADKNRKEAEELMQLKDGSHVRFYRLSQEWQAILARLSNSVSVEK